MKILKEKERFEMTIGRMKIKTKKTLIMIMTYLLIVL
jgi:hypothetical protein